MLQLAMANTWSASCFLNFYSSNWSLLSFSKNILVCTYVYFFIIYIVQVLWLATYIGNNGNCNQSGTACDWFLYYPFKISLTLHCLFLWCIMTYVFFYIAHAHEVTVHSYIYMLCMITFMKQVNILICEWICNNGSYTSNYKYLEIQFWSIQFNICISRIIIAACMCFFTNLQLTHCVYCILDS